MAQQTAAELRANLAENLSWRFAERDDEGVAQALHRGDAVDAVYTLDEAGLLDGFFAFLREHKIMAHWKRFTIAGVQAVFLPALYFLLLYGTRILFGIASTNALPTLLFSNIAVMTLIGFNAHAVQHGMTQRGASQRTGARPYTLMDPQTLSNTICKASATALEELFNGTIHCLAAAHIFGPEVRAAVDGTQVKTTKRFKGRGCLKVSERQCKRDGTVVEIVKLVYGWRLIALIDLTTLIPLAIKIVQIQQHEAPYILDLVAQAQRNLAPYSQITTLVVDRAYVDGPRLYAMTQQGIQWYLVAKSNMAIRKTAIALSAEGQPQTRTETVRHGHGQYATTEELRTRIVPVSSLRTWDAYRPPAEDGAALAFADRPTLNGVVVQEWRSQSPSDVGPRVILTNGPIDQPWDLVDAYDDRSWIENGLFRNSKQFWTLTRWFPKKSEAGVLTHLTFIMLMIATATAYRLWDKATTLTPETTPPTHLAYPPAKPTADAAAAPLLNHGMLEGVGAQRWRRELRRENRDKVIVFIEDRYGIYDTHEFAVLVGVSFRKLPEHLGTREDILRRFGCLPEAGADSIVKERVSVQDTIP